MQSGQPRRGFDFFDFTKEGALYEAPSERDVRVDCSREVGPIQFIVGTNRGPEEGLSDQLHELGITAIRTHDYYGPTDWWEIFPDWSADPDDPAGYDFASSDEVMASIVEGGFTILYRVGVSWRGDRPNWSNDPPGTIRDEDEKVIHVADRKDFEKWAKIVVNIIRHYNEGWAGGHRYGIKYWEIWNEPSLAREFWTGTPEQFYEMYEIVARAIKDHDPSLIVGVPGRAGEARGRKIPQYQQDLFAYCAKNGVPMDFYSWHHYGDPSQPANPYKFYLQPTEIRRQLDEHGFTETEVWNTEWNTTIRPATRNDGYGAAHYASTLICMLRAGCTQTYQYRGTVSHPELGLFLDSTTPKRSAYGLKAFACTIELPIQVHSEGDDEEGYNTLATMDKDKGLVRILISDFRSTSQAFNLIVTNLPWKKKLAFLPGIKEPSYTSTILLVDESHDLQTLRIQSTNTLVLGADRHRGTTFEYSRPMKSGSVVFIELERDK